MNLVFNGSIDSRESEIITNVRHQQALKRAKNALLEAQEALSHLSLDFVQVDVQEAMDALGEITGETLREDLVDYIFSHFCIGK